MADEDRISEMLINTVEDERTFRRFLNIMNPVEMAISLKGSISDLSAQEVVRSVTNSGHSDRQANDELWRAVKRIPRWWDPFIKALNQCGSTQLSHILQSKLDSITSSPQACCPRTPPPRYQSVEDQQSPTHLQHPVSHEESPTSVQEELAHSQQISNFSQDFPAYLQQHPHIHQQLPSIDQQFSRLPPEQPPVYSQLTPVCCEQVENIYRNAPCNDQAIAGHTSENMSSDEDFTISAVISDQAKKLKLFTIHDENTSIPGSHVIDTNIANCQQTWLGEKKDTTNGVKGLAANKLKKRITSEENDLSTNLMNDLPAISQGKELRSVEREHTLKLKGSVTKVDETKTDDTIGANVISHQDTSYLDDANESLPVHQSGGNLPILDLLLSSDTRDPAVQTSYPPTGSTENTQTADPPGLTTDPAEKSQHTDPPIGKLPCTLENQERDCDFDEVSMFYMTRSGSVELKGISFVNELLNPLDGPSVEQQDAELRDTHHNYQSYMPCIQLGLERLQVHGPVGNSPTEESSPANLQFVTSGNPEQDVLAFILDTKHTSTCEINTVSDSLGDQKHRVDRHSRTSGCGKEVQLATIDRSADPQVMKTNQAYTNSTVKPNHENKARHVLRDKTEHSNPNLANEDYARMSEYEEDSQAIQNDDITGSQTIKLNRTHENVSDTAQNENEVRCIAKYDTASLQAVRVDKRDTPLGSSGNEKQHTSMFGSEVGHTQADEEIRQLGSTGHVGEVETLQVDQINHQDVPTTFRSFVSSPITRTVTETLLTFFK
ncbi:uncharacterized protein LOC121384301 [Gigantopelta aegis]|uniref:uncharacterized protein LOC121384301 n=1 Tax=Gigantopelta aegis TaxID=1735272 RepID=UPI001B8886A2|nr:uncharacterized protein LOC121384301 [Gigantopelta aegis]XP_041370557.1 uncharacterized protein LOC121384301 [Gigantopelta aegis]